MDRQEIIRMARAACDQAPREDWNSTAWVFGDESLEQFANLVAAAEREILANWMRQHGFSTGQAYTTDSLLDRLGTEMVENVDAAVLAEREACAKLCDDWPNGRDDVYSIGVAIRARGEK